MPLALELRATPPARQLTREFAAVPDFTVVQSLLKDARLFEVKGRSAEPIALDGQFLITRPTQPAARSVHQLDQRLVVAIDIGMQKTDRDRLDIFFQKHVDDVIYIVDRKRNDHLTT